MQLGKIDENAFQNYSYYSFKCYDITLFTDAIIKIDFFFLEIILQLDIK